MKAIVVPVFAALLALGVGGPAWAHTEFKSGFNLFSTQQDVEIGQQNAAQIERQLPMVVEPASQSLVARVGARLAARAPGAKFPYRFRVVNLSDLNAFALPGGFIYVHRGLVEQVRTEGELAGVMAHEIAHVAIRHPTHRLTQAYTAQTGASLVARLLGGGSGGTRGQVVNTLGGLGLSTLFLKFSRSDEAEADALGARIMAEAGYDPNEMANFFRFMQQKAGSEPSRVATFFSSHPAPAGRETHIRSEARQYTVRRLQPVGGLRVAQAELRQLPPAQRMADVARASRVSPGGAEPLARR